MKLFLDHDVYAVTASVRNLTPATLDEVHAEMDRGLAQHSQAELLRTFVVVEPGRHRLRRLPRPS